MAEVNVENLKPNSFKYKNEEAKREKERAKPVVSRDKVVSTKKSLKNKMADSFMAEDGREIVDWLVWDLLVPGVKNTILDMLSMAFFGETVNRSSSFRRTNNRSRTNYTGAYRRASYRSDRDYDDRRDNWRRDREEYYRDDDKVDYSNIVLQHRSDAEDVIDEMKKRIRKEGAVTIADLFDMIDVPGEYTDNDWGWDDERDIRLRRVSNGWLIDVSKPRYVG